MTDQYEKHEVGSLPIPPVCDACGEEGGVTVAERTQSFRYGEGEDAVELTVEVPVYECVHCGLSYTDDLAEELRHAEVCRHLDRLPPSQIRGIRRLHGVSQEEFSEISRIGIASLARWETGAVIQNPGYDEYLRLLGIPEIFERVKRRREGASAEPERYTGRRHFPSLHQPERLRTRQNRFSLRR